MNRQYERMARRQIRKIPGLIAIAVALLMSSPAFAQLFIPGNLVVSVEGCGNQGGTCASVANGTGNGTGNSSIGGYGDNQGAPLSLFQYSLNGTTSASYVNSLVLPQTNILNGNYAVSGEYGSSSEGTLQLSGNGQYLTITGYGVNAAAFNASPATYSPTAGNAALGQSGSMTGQSYTAVPRVVALIDANGNVNSTTAVYNTFNTNNPRSAYTLNGTTVYISGQGSGSDSTAGVFLTTVGTTNNAPTPITGLDTTSNTISQDAREVQIYNGQLYVSVDSKGGSGSARSFVGTLGSPPATSLYSSGAGPTQLTGFGSSKTGQEIVTVGNTNGVNASAEGKTINLSPENYFFANSTTLYVADSGDGKQNSATSSLGDGGLQKWSLVSGTWVLDYTLSAGLGLVPNTDADGVSGLYGLTGEVIGGEVELFATSYTLSDLDQTYLYGITDVLSDTTLPTGASAEDFSVLADAPADSNFKGVAFAPTATPEPASIALLGLGMTALLLVSRRWRVV